MKMRLREYDSLVRYLSETPTNKELELILYKRKKLLDSSLDLRSVEDIVFYHYPNWDTREFVKLAKQNTNLTTLDCIAYILFNYLEIDIGKFKIVVNQKYIQPKSSINFYRFNSYIEAVRWIISYRLAKYFLKLKVFK